MPRRGSAAAIWGHEPFEETHRPRRAQTMAFGAKIYAKRLPRSKLQTIGRSAGNELGRRWIETQLRPPRRSIEAAIDERDFARTGRQFTQLAAPLALLTPH